MVRLMQENQAAARELQGHEEPAFMDRFVVVLEQLRDPEANLPDQLRAFLSARPRMRWRNTWSGTLSTSTFRSD